MSTLDVDHFLVQKYSITIWIESQTPVVYTTQCILFEYYIVCSILYHEYYKYDKKYN